MTSSLCAVPLSWLGSPKADPETRIWVQVVYLGGDSRKHSERVRRRHKDVSQANNTGNDE